MLCLLAMLCLTSVLTVQSTVSSSLCWRCWPVLFWKRCLNGYAGSPGMLSKMTILVGWVALLSILAGWLAGWLAGYAVYNCWLSVMSAGWLDVLTG